MTTAKKFYHLRRIKSGLKANPDNLFYFLHMWAHCADKPTNSEKRQISMKHKTRKKQFQKHAK